MATINVKAQWNEGVLAATSPDVQGLVTQADNEEHLVEMLQDAMNLIDLHTGAEPSQHQFQIRYE